jgi:hypothetical protein
MRSQGRKSPSITTRAVNALQSRRTSGRCAEERHIELHHWRSSWKHIPCNRCLGCCDQPDSIQSLPTGCFARVKRAIPADQSKRTTATRDSIRMSWISVCNSTMPVGMTPPWGGLRPRIRLYLAECKGMIDMLMLVIIL